MFLSATTTLTMLLVRTKNSEGLMWENGTLRKYTSDIVYVGDFSRTEDLSKKRTHMGKIDKRVQCIMNFSKCPGKCGCIIRSGGKSIGLPSIAFMYMCLSILNASQRLLLANGKSPSVDTRVNTM